MSRDERSKSQEVFTHGWPPFISASPILAQKKGIIDAATHQSLFSNIETLYNFNSKLLSDLQSDLKSHPNGGRKIGGIFKAFAPFFKMFTMYLEGFEKVREGGRAGGAKWREEREAMTVCY